MICSSLFFLAAASPMLEGSAMVTGLVVLAWLGVLALWQCFARANNERPSPEKPAGVPPADAVFLLPDGETWDAGKASWHVKAAGTGLNRREWTR